MLTKAHSRTIAQLEEQNRKLAARVKLLEDITHSMGHNFRGAVGSIGIMNDLLIEKAETGFVEDENEILKTGEILHHIGNSSSALLQTLNEMMAVVNQDLNEDLHFVDCDITEISNGVVEQLYGTVVQKHAKIVFNFAVKHFNYAKTHLENLLYNLISNSLKYSRPQVQPEIIVSSKMVNGHPVLAVEDNGLGIDLLKYGSILFGLNQTFHQGYDSRGIGLFITKRQIEGLGGKIAVASEVGRGTTFEVTL